MDSCLQSGTFKFSMERSSSRLDICFTMSKPSAAVPLRVLPCNLYREVSYFHISCAYHCHGDNNADHPNPIRANFLSSPLLSYLSYPAISILSCNIYPILQRSRNTASNHCFHSIQLLVIQLLYFSIFIR